MSIGEPQHAPPAFVARGAAPQPGRTRQLSGHRRPAGAARGVRRVADAPLRARRPAASMRETMVLPVNGTREALFAFVQAVVDRARARRSWLMPNPFYQIYEGAALLAGAQPLLPRHRGRHGFLPDLDAVPAAAVAALPGAVPVQPRQPDRRGAVPGVPAAARSSWPSATTSSSPATSATPTSICDEAAPPPGLLRGRRWRAGARASSAAWSSTASPSARACRGCAPGSWPGMRRILERFLLYRTYHGSAMPVPTQLASIAAWEDDAHAAANRALYQEKFARVLPILGRRCDLSRPGGAFYLWPDVGGDDEHFARELFATSRTSPCCPAATSARAGAQGNPGAGRVRISLVPPVERLCRGRRAARGFPAQRPGAVRDFPAMSADGATAECHRRRLRTARRAHPGQHDR